jgi:hypothetical protein
MKIYGVNKKQKKLLDRIWEFDDEIELYEWTNTLNKKKRLEVNSLKELIILSAIDERVDAMIEFPIIDELLYEIMES